MDRRSSKGELICDVKVVAVPAMSNFADDTIAFSDPDILLIRIGFNLIIRG